MIHEIAPRQYRPEFTPRPPRDEDRVLFFCEKKVLLLKNSGEPAGGLAIPRHADMKGWLYDDGETLQYLFSIDETAFFLMPEGPPPETGEFCLESAIVFRSFRPLWLAFAGITGSHLCNWYATHRFCGACGGLFRHSDTERTLICEACEHTVHPTIAPVIIVALMDGDRLLLTRYKNRPYKNYALVAGFVEIGESFEDAVRREVMEEVGLHAANIRYYKSQPWAFSGSLIAGFFADVDGERTIAMNRDELSEALWMHREDILKSPLYEKNIVSITSEMIGWFCDGKRT